MESLKDLLKRKQTIKTTVDKVSRLKTYIEKRYAFSPEIRLAPRDRMTIYAPTAAQASILRLDWANLNRLAGKPEKLYIRLKRIPKSG